MKKYIYRVTLCTKHGRRQWRTDYFIDVEADNAKEAKEFTEELWYRDHDRHAFHVKASRLHGQVEAEYFARTDDFPRVKACLDSFGDQIKEW